MSTTNNRREREKIEMRQLIVDSAIEMYIKEGYDKLTLRSIDLFVLQRQARIVPRYARMGF
jgi:hypothetical protein